MRKLFKVEYRATDLTGKVREKDRVGMSRVRVSSPRGVE